MPPIRNTIKPLKPDWRDLRFVHSKKFGTTDLGEIPTKGLGRVPLKINQQYNTNFCTGSATESAAEYEQGRKFSFEFQVAAIGRRVGEPITDGADPRKAYQARVAYGCLPDELTPYELRLTATTALVLAKWQSWPTELWQQAKQYVAESFFWLGEEYEPFDQVKEALWSARAENQVVMAAGKWYHNWNDVGWNGILALGSGPYTLHEYLFIDWTEIDGVEYLVIHNSCGEEFGKGGVQYINRETMNAAWPRAYGDGTGMAIWRKVHPDDVASLKRQWLSLAEILASILDALLFKVKYGIAGNIAGRISGN